MYELLWARELGLVFGTSGPAIATVTGIFLLGLGIGAALIGGAADKAKEPLRLYAMVEFGVAITAILSFILFKTPLFVWLHGLAYQHGLIATATARILLASIILLPCTALMGGAMPLLGRHMLERRRGFVPLYVANTLGAALGVLLAGFLLVRTVGVTATFATAAAINLAAGVLACAVKEERTTVERREASGNSLAAAVLFFSGALCLGVEVLWARILSLHTVATTYVFATILLGFLLGLTVGTAAAFFRTDRRRLAALAAAATGLAMAVCLMLFGRLPLHLPVGRLASDLLIAFTVSFIPATTMGCLFPVGVTLYAPDAEKAGERVGRAYLWNAAGSIVGSLATGFVLIPLLGLRGTGILFCGAAILGGGLLWPAHGRRRLVTIAGAAALVTITFTALFLLTSDRYAPDRAGTVRFYEEGLSATVAVTENGGERTLFVDNEGVASTLLPAKADSKLLAHLPLLLAQRPHTAATVGYGSGGTSASMLLHDIDVTAVEIEPAVVRASGEFRIMNDRAELNPRLTIVLDDARSYFASTERRFDVIATDVTNLKYKGNPSIYSKEYFALMKSRLADGGIAVAWLPLNQLHIDDVRTLVATFDAVYPHTTLWGYTQGENYFLIAIGTPGPIGTFREPSEKVGRDLKEIGIDGVKGLKEDMLLDEGEVDAFIAGAPLHTDDLPILEYSHLGSYFEPSEENERLLLRYDESATP